MNQTMVQVDGLAKRFGAVNAVQSLSFNAREGEIVGLVGPDGAGKTTTLRILSGVLPADAGVDALPDFVSFGLCDHLLFSPIGGAAPRPRSDFPDPSFVQDDRARLRRLANAITSLPSCPPSSSAARPAAGCPSACTGPADADHEYWRPPGLPGRGPRRRRSRASAYPR